MVEHQIGAERQVRDADRRGALGFVEIVSERLPRPRERDRDEARRPELRADAHEPCGVTRIPTLDSAGEESAERDGGPTARAASRDAVARRRDLGSQSVRRHAESQRRPRSDSTAVTAATSLASARRGSCPRTPWRRSFGVLALELDAVRSPERTMTTASAPLRAATCASGLARSRVHAFDAEAHRRELGLEPRHEGAAVVVVDERDQDALVCAHLCGHPDAQDSRGEDAGASRFPSSVCACSGAPISAPRGARPGERVRPSLGSARGGACQSLGLRELLRALPASISGQELRARRGPRAALPSKFGNHRVLLLALAELVEAEARHRELQPGRWRAPPGKRQRGSRTPESLLAAGCRSEPRRPGARDPKDWPVHHSAAKFSVPIAASAS